MGLSSVRAETEKVLDFEESTSILNTGAKVSRTERWGQQRGELCMYNTPFPAPSPWKGELSLRRELEKEKTCKPEKTLHSSRGRFPSGLPPMWLHAPPDGGVRVTSEPESSEAFCWEDLSNWAGWSTWVWPGHIKPSRADPIYGKPGNFSIRKQHRDVILWGPESKTSHVWAITQRLNPAFKRFISARK